MASRLVDLVRRDKSKKCRQEQDAMAKAQWRAICLDYLPLSSECFVSAVARISSRPFRNDANVFAESSLRNGGDLHVEIFPRCFIRTSLEFVPSHPGKRAALHFSMELVSLSPDNTQLH